MTDFSRFADRYDAGLLGRISRPFYRAIEAAAASSLTPGVKVLDVGCGTGALLAQLVRKFDIVGTGIDPSPQMVQIAQSAHPSLEITAAAAEELPFADNSFEVVLACLTYHHFANPHAFVAEASRVLAPGGKLVVAEPVLPPAVNALLALSAQIIRHDEVFQPPVALVQQISRNGLTAEVALKSRFITVIAARKH